MRMKYVPLFGRSALNAAFGAIKLSADSADKNNGLSEFNVDLLDLELPQYLIPGLPNKIQD